MANHKQALKRHRQSLRRRARNMRFKKQIKTQLKELNYNIEDKDLTLAKETLQKAIKVLSRGGSKGVIPKRRASRKISRITRQLNRAAAAE